MQNKQLSQERVESEPKRLEYRSPSLAKLGKLADLTLTTNISAVMDAGVGAGKDKLSA